jgi:cytochrome c peroxidase
MDKRYRDRYAESLIENSILARDQGLDAFLAAERKKWTCQKCEGIISLHDNECSECHTFFGKNRTLI